ncbi:MAG: SGNH/GDSL hydrolase family protein [Sporolactobacillus sp.]
MRKWSVAAILVTVLIAALAAGLLMQSNSRPKAASAKVYRCDIVALGDSLTQGIGDPKEGGYVGLTEQALKRERLVRQVTLKNYGHMGDTSADLLKNLQRDGVRAAIKQANIVFLTIGGNDIAGVLSAHFMNLSVADFKTAQNVYVTNLQQIFKTIRGLNNGVFIYFFGLYNPFEDYFGQANKDFQPILDGWNRASATVAAQQQKTFFLPTAALFKGKGDELLYDDHFHPNAKGYRLMSQLLVKAINQQMR